MMIPEVGSMPKVSGSSIATPEGGPTPGSAPMRMPTSTPAVAIIRLNGVKAMPNPMPKWVRKSMAASESPDHSFGHRYAQPVRENQPVEARRGQRDRQGHPPGMPSQKPHQKSEVKRG